MFQQLFGLEVNVPLVEVSGETSTPTETESNLATTSSAGQSTFTVAGLFAGIGGLELGLHNAGGLTEILCEIWEPARSVLEARFPDIPIEDDVRTMKRLPNVDVVTAGFPCTDLSQAGRTAGIHGDQSGLVTHLFRLLSGSEPRWVVIENVRNMLVLDQGRGMDFLVNELERLGFRWAYRLVDSRFTGVPQRRQRVLMVASREDDPRSVLFADDAGEPDGSELSDDAFGFYWTEGLTGLGWARDAVPTLKGGSGLGIPSPPAIWICEADTLRSIVTPGIISSEILQGFPPGWTSVASSDKRHDRYRWKLIGNAVSVGVSQWLGRRLVNPAKPNSAIYTEIRPGERRWPVAACGADGKRFAVSISMWPFRKPYRHLLDVVRIDDTKPLSKRAVEGFYSRMERSKLRFEEGFRVAIKEYAQALRADQSELG